MSDAIDNLRRLADRWRGRWHFDDDGVTLVVDDEYPTPIDDMDDAAKRELAELLNAIRPAVDETRAETARLTAELSAARAVVPADVEALLDAWGVLEIHTSAGGNQPADVAAANAARDRVNAAIARAIAEAEVKGRNNALRATYGATPDESLGQAVVRATRQPATVGGLLATAPTTIRAALRDLLTDRDEHDGDRLSRIEAGICAIADSPPTVAELLPLVDETHEARWTAIGGEAMRCIGVPTRAGIDRRVEFQRSATGRWQVCSLGVIDVDRPATLVEVTP